MSKPEYIRLDVTGYKQYLRNRASISTIQTGENVSVTKYIQRLIDRDMRGDEMDLGRKEKKDNRMQLLLTDSNLKKLEETSKETGLSKNEIIGRLIEKLREDSEKQEKYDFLDFCKQEIPEIFQQLEDAYKERR